MPKAARYNKQGEVIMSSLAYHRKIFSVPEFSKITGIPYQTLHRRLCVNFGRATADEIRAMIKGAAMTGEEIEEVFR